MVWSGSSSSQPLVLKNCFSASDQSAALARASRATDSRSGVALEGMEVAMEISARVGEIFLDTCDYDVGLQEPNPSELG